MNRESYPPGQQRSGPPQDGQRTREAEVGERQMPLTAEPDLSRRPHRPLGRMRSRLTRPGEGRPWSKPLGPLRSHLEAPVANDQFLLYCRSRSYRR